MENSSTAGSQSVFALRPMISRIAQEVVERIPNPIVNDVPTGVFVEGNREKISAILNHLFRTLVENVNDTEFKISVKIYSSITMLHIKGKAQICETWLERQMEPIQQLAFSMGGIIILTSFHNRVSTIAFSFVNAA